MTSYDLAIIGSGPGGYIAGLYASRRGLKACVIESGQTGGTCLNRGCIPTKSLLHAASLLSDINDCQLFGVNAAPAVADYQRMAKRREDVVLRLRTGIETLLRASKVDLVRGRAKFISKDSIAVDGYGDITAKNVIIASGSRPSQLPNIGIDEDRILSSDGLLALKDRPKSIVVIGAGVVGSEFAHLFNALGTKVTMVEFLDRIIPAQSREASKKLELIFKKRGIDIHISSKAESVCGEGPVTVKISGEKAISAEKVLVSVGRRPNTEDLDLGAAGVKSEKGFIIVDGHLRTAAANIYAIGDCVAGPQLAHKASYDAILACDNILGDSRLADYSDIPSCIWTEPEIASVGMTEEQARAKYPDARIAKFPYLGSGKAFLLGKSEGYIKIAAKPDGTILGVEIFGEGACELIAEPVLAKTAGLKMAQWARAVHAHPTLSEIVQEAIHMFCGTPLHGV